MHTLFKKYLDNQCSPTEVRTLLNYFQIADNESLLRELILQHLETADEQDEEIQALPVTNAVWDDISRKLDIKRPGKPAILKRLWVRVAAAAILIATLVTSVLYVSDGASSKSIAHTHKSVPESAGINSKAVLLLTNGSAIELDGAANGTLTKQGTTNIIKAAAGKLIYQPMNPPSGKVLYNTIRISRGGQYQVILSDGSQVRLNAASSLRYPVAFSGNDRVVELTGEAYFEVAPNASKAFKVKMEGKGEVEVLGTRFNVNAYDDEKTVNTTLLEGKVKLTSFTSGKSYIMKAGEVSQLDKNGEILTTKAESNGSIAWTTNSFNFYNADLRFVFRQLSRWYDVDVVYEGPIPYREFTGEIPRDTELSQVLNLLKRNNVDCRLEGKTLIVLQ